MYEGIKQTSGKPTKNSAFLKSKIRKLITEKDKQMWRRVEQNLEIFSRENSISKEKLDVIQGLPVLEAQDSEPTKEELNKAIHALACSKEPGEDRIPPEVIGKPVLLPIHSFLSLC